MRLPLPDDATVTLTVGQLRAIIERHTGDRFEGVPTADAAKITGESPRKLRRLWSTWHRVQQEGGRPEVRVARKTDAERSDLLFDRRDLELYASGEPAPMSEPEPLPGAIDDPDDADAIADHLLATRGTGGAS